MTIPEPIVPIERIVGIDERIDRDGQVLRPLDPDEVVAAARRLVDEHDIEALAVSFLWSFKNPSHEDAAVTAIRQAIPDLAVFSGADVNPVMREFERSTFALLNAYVGGAFDSIQKLADELGGARAAGAGAARPLRRRLDHTPGGPTGPARARRVRTRRRGRGVGGARRRQRRARRGHLRHGRHVVRRVGDPQRPRVTPHARRPHGRVDRAPPGRRRVDRRGWRFARLGRRTRHAARRTALGRLGPRARVLRQGRHRADGHRRPRGARLPRSHALPRRRDGARRRRRPPRLRRRRSGDRSRRATRPRGASARSPARG